MKHVVAALTLVLVAGFTASIAGAARQPARGAPAALGTAKGKPTAPLTVASGKARLFISGNCEED